MRTASELDPLYAEAARATAAGSRSFYHATRFFPRELARAAHAVYWFCRTTDDMVDECPTLEQGRRDLDQWAAALDDALRGRPPSHPVLILFERAVRRYSIPHDYPRELIEGMRMDLDGVSYPDFDALRVFCYRVASVVGLMMSHVVGFRPGALEYAADLGIAMQLTNILRDIGEDLRRGRVYIPASELAQFNCSLSVQNENFVELMKFQIARARRYYDAAMPGVALLNPEGRFAVNIAAGVYRDILARIERSGYDVLNKRAVVPASRKYWISAVALWRSA